LSDFFNNLSENFHSVKLQLDKGRGEFEKLNRKSEENRAKNQNSRSEVVQVSTDSLSFAYQCKTCRKLEKNGIQMQQLLGNLVPKKVGIS